MLDVQYAHNDRRDNGHACDTDIMSRTADIAVGGGSPRRVTFKNTWSSDDYWTLGVPVQLKILPPASHNRHGSRTGG